jgi:AraC-like DNA-binding protein
MHPRRRIDWSVIMDRGTAPGAASAPAWGEHAAPSDVTGLLLACEDLFLARDADALVKRAVGLALEVVGLVRAGIYLYDEPLGLMLGTWGTDLGRAIVDEHHAMFQLGAEGRRVFERAVSGGAHWTVVQDCPIITHDVEQTRIVGRGWVVCTPIRSAGGPLGMLYNDAGLTGAAIDEGKQARAAILCALVGSLLEAIRRAQPGVSAASPTPRHPAVARAVRMLERDPSLGGARIAAGLGVSLSRFARVFKGEVGLSLVDYRNRLRLERFVRLVDSGGTNLLEAALAAGFGSYAQFHRVFRAMRGQTPRQYLAARPDLPERAG